MGEIVSIHRPFQSRVLLFERESQILTASLSVAQPQPWTTSITSRSANRSQGTLAPLTNSPAKNGMPRRASIISWRGIWRRGWDGFCSRTRGTSGRYRNFRRRGTGMGTWRTTRWRIPIRTACSAQPRAVILRRKLTHARFCCASSQLRQNQQRRQNRRHHQRKGRIRKPQRTRLIQGVVRLVPWAKSFLIMSGPIPLLAGAQQATSLQSSWVL
jgi:hypothetical protein